MTRLVSLDLTDFKSHKSTAVQFANLNLFVGAAGVGKSSLFDAIALALAGRNRHTDARGAGMDQQIRRGQEGFTIKLAISNGSGAALIVTREHDGSKQTLLPSFDAKDLRSRQTLLLKHLGVTDEAIETLLDPRLFADRDPNSQKQVLLKLVGQASIVVPEAVKAVGITAIGSVADVELHIKSVKEGNIRQLNAAIKALQEAAPDEPTADELARAQAATEEEASALDAHNTATFKFGAARERFESADQQGSDAGRIERLRKREAELSTARPGLEELVQKCTSSAQAKRLVLDDGEREVGAANQRVAQMTSAIAALRSLEGKCPTCQRTMPAEVKKSLLDQLESNLVATRNQAAGTGKALEVFRTEFKASAEALAKAKAALYGNRSEAREIAASLTAFAGIKTVDRDALKKEMSELQAQVEVTETRLMEAQKASHAAANILSRRDECVRISEALESSRRKLAAYTQAVGELEAVKDKMLSSNESRKFEATLNGVWHGFYPTMDVVISPAGATIQDVEHDRKPLAVEYLSSGQKVILDAAIRIAASETTGFGILALDDANKLPEPERQKLVMALMKSKLQVLVAHTSDKPPKASNGVAAYMLYSDSLLGPTVCERL